jgi:DNA polymerase
MRLIFLDFESFFSKDYSLSKMTVPEYILSPHWQTLGCAVIDGIDGEPQWFEGDTVADWLRSIDVTEAAICAHNTQFDGSILSLRYEIYPRFYLDTLSMSRAQLSHLIPGGKVALASVAKHLGLPEKGGALGKVVGLDLQGIKDAGLYDELVSYALHDVDLCRQIFKHLTPGFPTQELKVIDGLVRMVTQPSFVINRQLLANHLARLRSQKETLLERVGLTKLELMSDDKFATALSNLGVMPPRKISPTTGREAWAFAKTDKDLQALQSHEDEDVQALIAARLGFKSTIEETRTERFIAIHDATQQAKGKSFMPVALKYSGAHTHRLSGDWSLNLQNLPSRGNTTLRDALEAPDGHTVVTCDASQVEARLTAWLSKQYSLVDQFGNNEDVYSSFASRIYGYPVTKKNKVERFLGKTCILGLGFNMGHAKFRETVRVQAAAMGIDMPMDEAEAQRIVNLYRSTYAAISQTWRTLNDMLARMIDGRIGGFELGPCRFEKDAILLPTGLKINYHNLRREDGNFVYDYGSGVRKAYGGKVLENCVQALDRVLVIDATMRVNQRFRHIGLHAAHNVHDEAVWVVPDRYAEEVRDAALEEFKRRPLWGLDLPLDAEAAMGKTFGACK